MGLMSVIILAEELQRDTFLRLLWEKADAIEIGAKQSEKSDDIKI